jgi:hypothetical protein
MKTEDPNILTLGTKVHAAQLGTFPSKKRDIINSR